MISTMFICVPAEAPDLVKVGRVVSIDADTEADILRDIKAIGNAVIMKAKREAEAAGRTFTEADRQKYENAFIEGTKMEPDEVREMDRPAFRKYAEKEGYKLAEETFRA